MLNSDSLLARLGMQNSVKSKHFREISYEILFHEMLMKCEEIHFTAHEILHTLHIKESPPNDCTNLACSYCMSQESLLNKDLNFAPTLGKVDLTQLEVAVL